MEIFLILTYPKKVMCSIEIIYLLQNSQIKTTSFWSSIVQVLV